MHISITPLERSYNTLITFIFITMKKMKLSLIKVSLAPKHMIMFLGCGVVAVLTFSVAAVVKYSCRPLICGIKLQSTQVSCYR